MTQNGWAIYNDADEPVATAVNEQDAWAIAAFLDERYGYVGDGCCYVEPIH